MARISRVTIDGIIYHILNRANCREKIFKKDEDFFAFEKIIVVIIIF